MSWSLFLTILFQAAIAIVMFLFFMTILAAVVIGATNAYKKGRDGQHQGQAQRRNGSSSLRD